MATGFQLTDLNHGEGEVVNPMTRRGPRRLFRPPPHGWVPLALCTTLFGVAILAFPTTAGQASSVAQLPGNTLSVGTGADATVLTSCRLAGTPEFSVFDPANGYIYTFSSYTGSTRSVAVLRAPCTLVGYVRIPGLSSAWLGGAAYDPQTKEIYVTNPPGFEVYVIQDLSLVRTIPVPPDDNWAAGPGAIAYDPATGKLLAAEVYSNLVDVLSGTTYLDRFKESSFSNARPDTVMVLPNNEVYFVNTWSEWGEIGPSESVSDITVVNASTYQRITKIPTGPTPEGLAWNPTLDQLYVGFGNCSGSAGIAVIDTASNDITRTIVLPKMTCPVGLGYAPATRQVFVTEEYRDLLWMVTPSGRLTSIPFFQGSGGGTGVTFDPLTSNMYVCGPHRMYVISLGGS